MSIRWINHYLGTSPFDEINDKCNDVILDVRDIVDRAGNEKNIIRSKIQKGVSALKVGKRVIVCCDYGVSRSNAIAAGIISLYEDKGFDECLKQVIDQTGETQIKHDLVVSIREALNYQPKTDKSKPDKLSILITGGNGFIGKSLLKAINEDFICISPSSEELDLLQGNSKLDLIVNQNNINYIIHLANPKTFSSNIAMGQTLNMLRNVIDICLYKNIILLYISNWEIYSGYKGTLHVNESTPLYPRGIYGETKYLAEKLIDHFCNSRELRCALIRSSTIYGDINERPKFFHHFIEKAHNFKPIITHCFQNGEPALDLLHIDDLILAIISIINNQYIGKLNVGTGVLTSTNRIATLICEKIGSHSKLDIMPIETDTARIAMDWSRAYREIGWEPKINLNDGLGKMLSPMKLNKE